VIQRVSWAAVLAGLLTILSIAAAVLREQALVLAFGLSAVTWAILSLKDRT
jgi:hypothetical protein